MLFISTAWSQDLAIGPVGVVSNITSGTNTYNNTYIGQNIGDSNNFLGVSEPGTLLANNAQVFVGFSGSSNRLEVIDGGVVNASIIYAGFQPGANHNQVIVGSNSTITTTGLFDVGHLGSSNSLVITNGGKVFIGAGGSSIGSFAVSGNSVLVTGSGSMLSNVSIFYVGFQGASNQLTLSNQGSLISDTLAVGGSAADGFFGSNNTVLVTSSASMTVNSDLFVGREGAFNSMTVSGGGTVTAAVGYVGDASSSSNNSVLVTSNSVWTNSGNLYVGDEGSSNSMVISNGGTVGNAFGTIGFENNSSNNSALVTGAGSSWTSGSNLVVGLSGNGNSLVISNGGLVANAFGTIGFNTNASNNSVLVKGVDSNGDRSTWTNGSELVVGNLGRSNTLVISNGGAVASAQGSIGYFTNSSNNSVTVTGVNSNTNRSIWSIRTNLEVGLSGSGNTLTIADGAIVQNETGYIGSAPDSSNNSVLVTGGNSNGTNDIPSTWSNASFVIVGSLGSSNSLVISNGAEVQSAGGLVGVGEESSNNRVEVAGAGSRWTNSQNLWVGLGGSSNGLEISNGGRVEGIRGYIGYGTNSSNNTVLVTGTNSNGISTWTNSDDLYVGYDGSGNSLTIESGATVANTFGYIGYGTNSSNNFAVVTGAGSTWSNNGNFIVGHFGSSNRLIISNGGNVLGGDSYIGDQPGSSNNYVLVTDSNSTWTSADRLFVGHFGSSNSLVISNGATVANTGGVIGSATSSSNNSVLVTGTNANGDVSTWTNSGDLVVGEDGSSNSLVISNEGGVLNAVGYVGRNTNSSNNSVLVTGINSTWTNFSDLAIGSQGSSNTLVISNGATVANTDGVIGSATSSSNNSVLVTDGGTWTNSGNLFVGSSASGNSLVISNEGRVANVGGFIGNSTSSSNNSVLVTDGGTWTNSSSLYVGNFGSSNRLVISNGGTVASFIGHIGNDSASSNNSVVVKGSNSFWTNSFRLYVGLSGSGNSLVISNEGTVANIEGYIGYYAVSSNNGVLVTSNSLWTNSGELGVGFEGSGNNLVISNGGRVANAVGYIGRYSMSSNNSVLVADGGTWTNSGDLYVGYDGSGNSLTIESGATVANTFGYIGYGTNSSNNFAVVTGAGSAWSNSGDFIIGYNGSSNSLTVSDGGNVSGANSYVGDKLESSNNSVLVAGADSSGRASTWTSAGFLYVGHIGSSNRMVISNGGAVTSAQGRIGFETNSSINSVLVVGANSNGVSTWTNSGDLVVGENGSGNRLEIADGGRVAATTSSVGSQAFSSNNVVLVTGSNSLWTNSGNIFFGNHGASNTLTVSDRGKVASGSALVGHESNSIGNEVVIAGDSSWSIAGDFTFGDAGASNTLVLSNVGIVAATNSFVGSQASSSNNVVLVTGSNSLWTNSGNIFFGNHGASNTLTVSDRGKVASGSAFIGYESNSIGNEVLIVGASSWSNSGTFVLGNAGSSNTLGISNGAILDSIASVVGSQASSSNNVVEVTGAGLRWTNALGLSVGDHGSDNRLTISNGAIVAAFESSLGVQASSSNNRALVTGDGSRWITTQFFYVGNDGSGNRLEIADGGVVEAGGSFLGATGSSNSALVTGVRSRWTNSGGLYVGQAGSGNRLEIADGGSLVTGGADIGFWTNAFSNTVTVTGVDSTWTNLGALSVGNYGSSNSLVISNGGAVTSIHGRIGSQTNSSNNSVLVTGTNSNGASTWTNRGDLYVGYAGSGNILTVSNGGLVTAQFAYVGRGGDFNEAVVISNGRVAADVVYVGDTGMSNSFSVLSGGQVEALTGLVGADANATGNMALISGPGAVWSNTFTFFVGHSGSGNNLVVSNGGKLVVGGTGYVGFNMASSNSAVVTGAGSVWTNGGDLYIGYNGNRNSLLIEDGGAVYNVNGYDDGLDPLDNSNMVTVTGSGSRWVNSGNLTFGLAGHGNTLNVYSNGLVTVGTNAILGDLATASNNTVFVAGTGSRLEVGETVFVGKDGGDNLLLLLNGGTVTASSTIIGGSASSVSNHVSLVGGISRLANSGDLIVGQGGSANRLSLITGGVATANVAYVGYSTTSAGNTVFVSGPGAEWSNTSVFLGYHGASNSLNVLGGGRVVTTGSSSVGYAASSSNNSVVIDGSIGLAVWENQGILYLGVDGEGNSLSITNGGNLITQATTVGASAGNLVTVSGGGSVWSNTGTFLLGFNAGNNSVVVSDSGSLSAGSVGIGLGGSSNRMTVSGGSFVQVTNTSIIGLDTNSSNGSVLVTGDGTVWSNAGQFILGMEGVGHSLTVSDGATLSATDINIAPFTGSEGTLNIGEFGGSNAAGIIDAALIGFGVGTGAVNFNQTNTFALTNTVTGAGSLNQLGSGTLFLGGDLSTFTGTLSAAVGTIVISNLTHLGRTTNMLLGSGGTFDVAQGGTNTISLDMSVTNGTGNIVNSGGGTLVLATNISKSGSVLVLAGGDFVVNGVISGSGAQGSFNSDLVLGSSVTPGPATVTINTPATYVGPTIIRAGSTLINGTNNALPGSTVVTLGDVATDSATVNRYDIQGFDQTIGGLASVGPANNVVEGDGTLTVSGPSSTVFNGVLDGAMAVVRAGTGATILGGANTYSGGTTVQSGRLVTANAAALGTGRVTLLGGTLELQSQLDIGSLLWDGAATVALPRAGAGQFLKVTGLLELTNGVNNFNVAGAALPRSPVKLLTSTNLASLSTNDFGVLGLGSYTLSIDGDSLYLTAQDISYQSFAITPNQVNVAKALDNFIGASGDRGTVSAALDTLAISQYPAAFEQLMPSQYASLPSMAFNTANALNSSMFRRLWATRVNGKGFTSSGMNLAPMQAEMGGTDDMGAFAINPTQEAKWGAFADGNGIFASAASTGSVQNYRSQSGGVTTGASYRWNDNLSTGVYAGYQGLQAEYDSGRTIDNAVRFGVFGTYAVEDLYFNALVGGAYHGYTVNRYINFGGLDRTATGRPGGGEFDLALGGGYDFQAGDLTFGPFTTLQYTYLGVEGFTETGAGALNLDVEPYNSSSLLYTLGAQIAYNWRVSSKVTLTPSVFAGWQHEFLQNGYAINSSFSTGGPASPFTYNTSPPARDYVYGGAGVTVGLGDRWSASFIYSAFAADADVNSQNLYLSLGVEF